MTRLLFLFSPVFFGGLFLLVGETFNWVKQVRKEKGFTKVTVVLHSGRK